MSLGSIRSVRSRTDPLLGELPGLLVLGVPQQLHDSLLVRGETGNLSDDVPDEDLLLAIDGRYFAVSPVSGIYVSAHSLRTSAFP